MPTKCSNGIINTIAIDNAAANGHVDVIDFLYSRGHHGSSNGADHAANGGHLNTIKYLNNKGIRCSINGTRNAAEHGYLNIISFIYENYYEIYGRISNLSKYFDNSVADMAAMNGHRHIIEYLHTNLLPICTIEGVRMARQNGHNNVYDSYVNYYTRLGKFNDLQAIRINNNNNYHNYNHHNYYNMFSDDDY
jgi:hypothetical protein